MSEQPRNPLHGVTLAMMVQDLVDHFGWVEPGRQVPIRCFTAEPSLNPTLQFLRRTPWTRAKVESLSLVMRWEQARAQRAPRLP